MLDIFTDNWSERPALNNGERLLRLLTNTGSELYVIVDDTITNVDAEIAWSLRRMFGRHAVCDGYEDVSDAMSDCIYMD